MHLIWENLIKNLISLWTGDFKGLDEGTGSYVVDYTVWAAIGEATAASGSTIPGCYGAHPPNFIKDKSATTADTWSFWTLYIGPILLYKRFRDEKYYRHFIKLVKLLNICLQFTVTRAEIEVIREGFIDWVKEYEELYYQYDPMRVSTCPLTVHALLHIADMIVLWGPVWAYWAFPMERFCGLIRPAIKSRKHPDASLDRYLLEVAQLFQITLVYNAQDMSHVLHPRRNPSNPDDACTLLPPSPAGRLTGTTLRRISRCLSTRYNLEKQPGKLRALMAGARMREFAQFRIDEGDTISAASMNAFAEDRRDSSYIRYQILVDRNASRKNAPVEFEMQTFYARLQHIIAVQIPKTPAAGVEDAETVLLAGITDCDVYFKHDDLDIHYYKNESVTEQFIDLNCIQCLVGRVAHNSRVWAIIDRSGVLSRAIYTEDSAPDISSI
ncbi:hypothetical protein DENSPDRAFT_860222 [Dentipellis sp. KUC8613]|nr:hypothetical protein DENSPDRAFT_860222 [Dentipellis sp. KUC8613]